MKNIKNIILFLFASFCSSSILAKVTARPNHITSNSEFDLLEKEDSFSSGIFKLQLQTIDSPIVRFGISGDDRVNIVDRINSAEFLTYKRFSRSLGLGLDFSINQTSFPTEDNSFGFGDARVFLKSALTSQKSLVDLSFMGEVFVPLQSDEVFISNNSTGYGGRLNLSFDIGDRIEILGNLGYYEFSDSIFEDIDYSQYFLYGAGLSLKLTSKWNLKLEALSRRLLRSERLKNLGEFQIGSKYKIAKNQSLGLNLNLASFEEDDSSRYGVSANYSLTIPTKKHKIPVPRKISSLDPSKRQCRVKTSTKNYYARALRPAEKNKLLNLPYKQTLYRYLPSLDIGEKSGLTQEGASYVKNSLVLFAVDILDLPESENLIDISEFDLRMNVQKLSNERAGETELICLLGEGVCSGGLYKHSSWKAHINDRFFKEHNLANTYFSHEVLKSKIDSKIRGKVYSSDLILKMGELIRGSDKSLEQILYRGIKKTGSLNKKTIYFTVADDIFVSSDTQITMVLRSNLCE